MSITRSFIDDPPVRCILWRDEDSQWFYFRHLNISRQDYESLPDWYLDEMDSEAERQLRELSSE